MSQQILSAKSIAENLYAFKKYTVGYLKVSCESTKPYIEIFYGADKNNVSFKAKLLKADNGYKSDQLVCLKYLKFVDVCKIEDITIDQAIYKFDSKSSFITDNEFLNSVYEMGAYTLNCCAIKFSEQGYVNDRLPRKILDVLKNYKCKFGEYILVDGPRRDREGWLGDLRTENLISYTAFGDNLPAKNSINAFSDLSNENMPSSLLTRQNIFEYTLWWIICVKEHFEYTGDKEFLIQMLPTINKICSQIMQLQNEKLYVKSASWMWSLGRDDYTSACQCVQYKALLDMAYIHNILGKETDDILSKANTLKQNIITDFWDENKGVFKDINNNSEQDIAFLDTNCFAICFGIASDKMAERILSYIKQNMWCKNGSTTTDKYINVTNYHNIQNDYIKSTVLDSENPIAKLQKVIEPHNKKVWPYIVCYEIEARFMQGDISGAFELIDRCYKNMVDSQYDTFWEMALEQQGGFPFVTMNAIEDTNDFINSECHGWSGYISHLLLTYVAGIKPLEAGYKKIILKPNIRNLKTVKCEIVTNRYNKISLNINKSENNINIVLQCDKRIEVLTDFSSIPEKYVIQKEIIYN